MPMMCTSSSLRAGIQCSSRGSNCQFNKEGALYFLHVGPLWFTSPQVERREEDENFVRVIWSLFHCRISTKELVTKVKPDTVHCTSILASFSFLVVFPWHQNIQIIFNAAKKWQLSLRWWSLFNPPSTHFETKKATVRLLNVVSQILNWAGNNIIS